jgi:hypothetical protein
MVRATKGLQRMRQTASAWVADGDPAPAFGSRVTLRKIKGCTAPLSPGTMGMVAESNWHVD